MTKTLNRPIDIAILVYFRFFGGLLFSQELINGLIIGKFHEYTTPEFHFSYQLFDWFRPWPYWGMVLHYGVTILAGFSVAMGFKYRLSSIVLFLGYTLLFIMDMTEYINHTYLYCLVSFWLIWLPLDQKNLKSTAPAWMLYLVLFHMGLAYFFGGIAKINPDWLRGSPMDLFLKQRLEHPLGKLYNSPGAHLIFSWGGLIFDLFIVPALLWKRTRKPAFIAAVFFHLSNVIMFGLATFPWFSILLSTMFFDPSWPRIIPHFKKLLPSQDNQHEIAQPLTWQGPMAWGLCLYLIIHLSLPLRHHLYPGNTSWTEQGHMFAWRMMLRDKVGQVRFWIHNQRTGDWRFINLSDYLTKRQQSAMMGKPEFIIQFAHFLKDKFKNSMGEDIKVFASSRISLNGRPMQELIRPGTDLSKEQRGLHHYSWINELEEDSKMITLRR